MTEKTIQEIRVYDLISAYWTDPEGGQRLLGVDRHIQEIAKLLKDNGCLKDK